MSSSNDDKIAGTLVLPKEAIAGATPALAGETACIILLHPVGPELGRRTPLTKDCFVVGREASLDLCINRDSVSRRHAQLVRRPDGSWLVDDLGSTNGTFVNEKKIDQQVLEGGDQVRFGDAIYKFLGGSNVESAYHEEIYQLTIQDGLTGVHNKRFFLDFLERELASADRHKRPLALVMLDVDHFKNLNDERGHLAGDAVLKSLARRIKSRIRREDLFARYGGEEFAAVLTVTEMEGALRFADHLRGLIADTPFSFGNDSFPVTVSLGVAAYDAEAEPAAVDAINLIGRADKNLYEAKRLGRNRVFPGLE